jgi:hypothetical protein
MITLVFIWSLLLAGVTQAVDPLQSQDLQVVNPGMEKNGRCAP